MENNILPSFEEFERNIYDNYKKDNCDSKIVNLLRKTIEDDISSLTVAELVKKYYFINGIEEFNDSKVSIDNNSELELKVKDYLKSNNILCDDDSFVNKSVKVKKVNTKPSRVPKKPVRVIEKDDKGNVKKYTSLKTCLWSNFKSINYELYKSQFSNGFEIILNDHLPKESTDGIPSRAHFNKLSSKFWKTISDIEKVEYVKDKKFIDWVNFSETL